MTQRSENSQDIKASLEAVYNAFIDQRAFGNLASAGKHER